MYGVEFYAAVRLAVVDEGLSHYEAGRRFGIDRRTVKKILSYSAPPGYRRTKPVTLDDVLTGSSFRLPLAAVDDNRAGGGPVVWGRGERQALESTDSAFAWDGTVLTGQLGIDGSPTA